VNLKRRLERLTGAPPMSSAAVPIGSTVSDAASGARAPVSSVVERAPPSAEKQRTLDELRRQMHALLERGERSSVRAAPRPAPALGVDRLPFVARQTPSGTLWQRIERLAPAHRVGDVATLGAAAADPGVLAELALDPSVAATSSGSWLFVDTETTGLGGSGALVLLVGMATLDPTGAVVVEQLLLAEPSEELALLECLSERVNAASLLVSFNGKAFDRPMLEGRIVMNRLPRLPARPHLDLLHVGRRLHRQRLGRCTLKILEREVLGFERGEDIDGSEVGPIYSHFLRSGDATELAAVVAHNFWDVVSMVALVGLYGQRTPPLLAEDLAGLARTLKRAGATGHAERVADIACERGGGAEAYRVRAELAKSRGDCASAVRDFERLCAHSDDPSGRLELVKLYEHKLREPARALHWLELGTNENTLAQARRRERLQRKLRRDSP
jgi:uncharacterized protein YprB with RNaseH-like and TPR domain